MTSVGTLDARASVGWLRRFARTTPGLVGLVAVIVAACCVIAGVVCAAQLNGRIAERNDVLGRSEPFAYSAQKLYAALSAADAAASSAYLSGGLQTAPMRTRYQQALADAASALTDATAGAADAGTRTALARISAGLAAYTGKVESARANNLQGFPVGSAYLREAASLMQTSLLPGAEQIYTDNLAALEADQRAVGSLPIVGLVLLAGVLAAIVVGSLILVGRTNRQFNKGLVVAAGLVLLVIAWIVVANRFAAASIDQSRTEGTARFEQLAKARILAQEARTDETLQLITRGDLTAGEKSFNGHIGELSTLVAQGPAAAVDGVVKWTASHRKQVERYDAGDYPGAVAQAVGADPSASAAQFAAVESSLSDAIEQTRANLRGGVSTAGSRLTWSPTGTLILMVIAGSATVVGLWPRLKEFL
ncbi:MULTISPECIES: hypothetical protein [unclassified Mycobacterium]|uniref:hypothetical protein n=1 Tax=unclassified Mycobacterium TaxID=2642494 RepID=UPI0029C80EE5|nr:MULTISPECIES: hypothetical protein [unclassified Mycobacterium]